MQNYIKSKENISNKKDIKTLNILRVLAALSIVLYHYTQRYDETIGHLINWKFMWANGAIAVDVFFILSGFLAFRGLKQSPFIKTLKKKIIRLYPAYWMCIIITSLFIHFLLPEKKIDLFSVLINFTMFQSFIGIKSVDGAYWTLIYEMIFYIFIAIVQTRKDYEKNISNVLFIWIIFAFTVQIGSLFEIDNFFSMIFKVFTKILILDRVYAFIIGGIISKVLIRNCKKIDYLTLTLALLFPLFLGNYMNFILVVVISIILIVFVKMENENQYVKNTKIDLLIKYLAAISYPFYLLHQYIGFAIIQYLEKLGFVKEYIIIIPVLIILIMASIVHELIEVRLKRKLLTLIL